MREAHISNALSNPANAEVVSKHNCALRRYADNSQSHCVVKLLELLSRPIVGICIIDANTEGPFASCSRTAVVWAVLILWPSGNPPPPPSDLGPPLEQPDL